MSEIHPAAAPAALQPEKEDSDDNEEEEALRDAGVELCLHSLQPSSNQQAPIELLAEFVRCVMSEEYVAAKILCNKVIELEPDNQTAREFLPVLQERLTLDEEMETESSSSEESTDEDTSSSEEDSSTSEGEKDNRGENTNSYNNRTSPRHCHSHRQS